MGINATVDIAKLTLTKCFAQVDTIPVEFKIPRGTRVVGLFINDLGVVLVERTVLVRGSYAAESK
jgi:hypothetical protein